MPPAGKKNRSQVPGDQQHKCSTQQALINLLIKRDNNGEQLVEMGVCSKEPNHALCVIPVVKIFPRAKSSIKVFALESTSGKAKHRIDYLGYQDRTSMHATRFGMA